MQDTTELSRLLAAWRRAVRPEEVFGVLDPPGEAALKRRYRELARQTHPDHNRGAKAAAEEAFKLLEQWYAAARRKVEQGCYGVEPRLEIFSGTRHYTGDGEAVESDLCVLYPASTGGERVLLKVARDPRDNDLLQAEARHLKRIGRELEDQPLRAHFPTLVEAFRVRDEAGVERHANALREEAGYVSAAQVLCAYPNGIDAADMVWMFNRVLAALGVLHSLGIVHGALVPAHILLRPSDHNGMLVDWCYSIPVGEPIKAISSPSRAFYPPEVLARQPAGPATDLYMAAACMVRLLGGDVASGSLPPRVPNAIQALLRGCLIASPQRRADDAWELFETLRDVARRVYGPPVFRPFVM